jgi:hypothetical protein
MLAENNLWADGSFSDPSRYMERIPLGDFKVKIL